MSLFLSFSNLFEKKKKNIILQLVVSLKIHNALFMIVQHSVFIRKIAVLMRVTNSILLLSVMKSFAIVVELGVVLILVLK